VLFLFVIMLLGVDRHESLVERIRGQRTAAIALGAGLVIELVVAIRAGIGFSARAGANFEQGVNHGNNTLALSRVLFRRYVLPFEATSVLLLVAAIAVMVLASTRRRAITRAEQTAAEEARVREAAAGGTGGLRPPAGVG
jgi:NADH-quinone oxidoreductase subunit J